MWERNLEAENLLVPIKLHYRDSNQTPLHYISLPLPCLLFTTFSPYLVRRISPSLLHRFPKASVLPFFYWALLSAFPSIQGHITYKSSLKCILEILKKGVGFL